MTTTTDEHLDFIPPHEERPGPGYERSDMGLRVIIWFGVFFAGLLGVAHVLLIVMFYALKKEGPPVTPLSPPAVAVSAPIIGPQLEVNPSINWDEMRSGQETLLHSYGWVNPQAGIVRIPIEQARELALQRGFPTRPATQPGGGG